MTILTDEEIDRWCAGNNYAGTVPGSRRFARAIESAACADRDARIAELEQRNRDLYEDVQRFKEHALSEKDARMVLERELAEVRKDAERLNFIESMGYGIGWIARNSTTGRGYRLHNDKDGTHITARGAIDAAMKGTP